jgi:hypothetical protein
MLHSQESLRALAKRYGINRKTAAKLRKRTGVAELKKTGQDKNRLVFYTADNGARQESGRHQEP